MHLERQFFRTFPAVNLSQFDPLKGFDLQALAVARGVEINSLRGRDIPSDDLTAFLDTNEGMRLRNQLQEQFGVSSDFTSCRSEFFPDPGGRGFENPVSTQERCLARFHEGREIEPTGFTATAPVAGGTLERVVRAVVPAILTVGITTAVGSLLGGALTSRVEQTRPPATVAVEPAPAAAPTGLTMEQVFGFIRRNGIFLALGLGLFAFLRRA